MVSLNVSIVVSALFIFCLIPLSMWYHSVAIILALDGSSESLGNAIYIVMIVIYVLAFIYFIASDVIYLINKYRLIKELNVSRKLMKSLYITNYFMMFIILFLPLIIAQIAYPNFNYNFVTFLMYNVATLLGVILLQIVYGDLFRSLPKK